MKKSAKEHWNHFICLTEKKDGRITARFANANPCRQWMDRNEVSSPTVTTEAIMLTGVIEALEREMLQPATFLMHL